MKAISLSVLLVCLLAASSQAQMVQVNCTDLNMTINMNSTCIPVEEPPYASCPDPEACEKPPDGTYIGLAFGLTIAAGLATTVGAVLPFIPCIKRLNKRFLAGGLSLAAGFMLYVTLTEIWNKSRDNYCCATVVHYNVITTFTFFAGILMTIGLDIVGTLLQRLDINCGIDLASMLNCRRKQTEPANAISSRNDNLAVVEVTPPSPPPKDSTELEMDETIEEQEPVAGEEFKDLTEGLGKETDGLKRMGILTCFAIAMHNFPEGLATFVATLSDPTLGASLAIAIAFHNIPEGVCVAMPMYYATGKKWKGFAWAFLSGVSEPFGALLGWLILRDVFGPIVYGVCFGLVAGMMVFVSLKHLLPVAIKFDDTPGGFLVSTCLVVGMALMAVSLVLEGY